MSLIASIANVPPDCEIVEVVRAFKFVDRLSQEGYLINSYPPFALTTEIRFSG
jgi:hypothetical protein